MNVHKHLSLMFRVKGYPKLVEQWEERSPVKDTPNWDLRDVNRINNFFRLNLGLLPTDTMEARSALNFEGDFNAWSENFEEFVLPVLIKRGIPPWNTSS